MQLLYDVFVEFFDRSLEVIFGIFGVFIPGLDSVISLSNSASLALPYILPFFVFWFDTDLFPFYFQA